MSFNRKDIFTANKHVELQHRHFAVIAAALADSKPTQPEMMAQWQSTVNSFIAICRSSNPRFDQQRFIAACSHQAVRS